MPLSRTPVKADLHASSDLDLHLFIASQKYNLRARRRAQQELRRRLQQPALQLETPQQSAPSPKDKATPPSRPKGAISDVAWLGVLLGAGALSLHIIGWVVTPA